MAAYNVAPYIARSIESILGQSNPDFELIIIDDASSDETPHVIAGFQDQRIVSLRNEVNGGAAAARTSGLEAAQGEYIAIADADDISLPGRLEKQAAFLDEHPEVGIVGAQYQRINPGGKLISKATQLPLSHNAIIWGLFTGHSIAHPANMIRATALDAAGRYYQSHLSSAEDYELWMRLLFVTRFANLPDILVHYRQWPGSLSSAHADTLRANAMITFTKVTGQLLGKPVPGDLHLHSNALYLRDHLLTEEQAHEAIKFQIELYQALLDADLFDAENLEEVHSSMAIGAKVIARHSPRTTSLIFGIFWTLARIHSPLWLRRLWVRMLSAFRDFSA